ncbi:MAG: hypothetical protein VB835_05515 [Pirellulales bacterium]
MTRLSRKLSLPLVAIVCAIANNAQSAAYAEPKSEEKIPRVAAVVTAYYHNSHADVIVSRLLEGYTLNNKGEFPKLKLVSLYIDQVPANDKGYQLAARHKVPIFKTVAGALTLGGDRLAVDGVLLIAEHGKYPKSKTGQTIYPKRRLFSEVVKVFRQSDQAVPVFVDKHLADNWIDAKWLYDTAERMKIPLMAGSSLPTLWRYPANDVRRNAQLSEVVVVSYHSLDSYGFHALELVQALVERRRGGETGVKSVRCVEAGAVWQAGRRGEYDSQLLAAALSRLRKPPLPRGAPIEQLAKQPNLMAIHYQDGLRVNVLTLNHAVSEWSAAWRYADSDQIQSTLFWTQESRPYMHFSYLVKGIEQMLYTRQPAWRAERTLLTSGILHAAHQSLLNGRPIDTPHLKIKFKQSWNWQQPPPPPPGRPRQEQ